MRTWFELRGITLEKLGGVIVEKAVKYFKLIASVAEIITLISVAIKLSQMNYYVLAECIVMVICILVRFICSAYDFVKKN